jgi:hypothetical protein
MARRANKGIPPIFIGLIVLLLAAAVGGSFVLRSRGNDPFHGVAVLDVREYLDNGNSLRGNVFQVTGKIQHQLSWSPSKGRLLSVEVEGSYGSDLVPILVPVEFDTINFQRGQTFVFKIGVGERGILTAQQIQKS